MIWYPWTISNKYYTADVSLCVVPSTFKMCSEVAQSMQAFVVYFNSAEVSAISFTFIVRCLNYTSADSTLIIPCFFFFFFL